MSRRIHPDRMVMIIACAATGVLTAVLLAACIMAVNKPTFLTFCAMLVIFTPITAVTAQRAFLKPDRWYRQKALRAHRFRVMYPRLAFVATTVGILGILIKCIKFALW